jgi:hypothetical protein
LLELESGHSLPRASAVPAARFLHSKLVRQMMSARIAARRGTSLNSFDAPATYVRLHGVV